MVILRVGALSGSAYERMQHLGLAVEAGWGEHEIDAIEAGSLNTPRERAILDFVESCVRDVKVSEPLFGRVAGFYSQDEIAELTLLVGHYMMTARFLETLEVELDQQATSWSAMSS